jgi:hypothetical protein
VDFFRRVCHQYVEATVAAVGKAGVQKQRFRQASNALEPAAAVRPVGKFMQVYGFFAQGRCIPARL